MTLVHVPQQGRWALHSWKSNKIVSVGGGDQNRVFSKYASTAVLLCWHICSFMLLLAFQHSTAVLLCWKASSSMKEHHTILFACLFTCGVTYMYAADSSLTQHDCCAGIVDGTPVKMLQAHKKPIGMQWLCRFTQKSSACTDCTRERRRQREDEAQGDARKGRGVHLASLRVFGSVQAHIIDVSVCEVISGSGQPYVDLAG